jgi:hypothetical protein
MPRVTSVDAPVLPARPARIVTGLSPYIPSVLKSAAGVLLILLARKALIDVDLYNYDSLAYHLPFAARFSGITSPAEFAFLDHLEVIYRGFPLLGEILQGVLWVFFDHMPAANLLALGSVVLYCHVARVVLLIPWHLTFLGLLAVPLVQAHAIGSLVDLPANLAAAVVLLLAYRAYAGTTPPPWRDMAVLAVAAGVSVNMKFLHTGLVMLALAAVGGRLAYLYRAGERPVKGPIAQRCVLLAMAMPFVFATAVKNTLLYKNPFYPLAFSMFGETLPHTMRVPSTFPDYLKGTPQAIRWLLSVAEFRAFDARRPILWMGEQGYLPAGAPADRMGGYFFLYVIVNVLLLALLIWRVRSREARVAGIFFLLLSIVIAAHPQSHELRYYMCWMIVLITLNLSLLSRAQSRRALPVTLQHFGLVCCILLVCVIWLTHGAYIRPTTQPIVVAYTAAIEPTIQAAIEKGPMLCVVGNTNLFFFYADTFHPHLRYSIKAAQAERSCGSRVVIPAR